jgi:hypothetical protein
MRVTSRLNIVIVLFGLLSSVLIMSFSFAQAQNLTNTFQTNASNSEAYIPPTISKRAQEILKNLVSNAPSFVIPSPDDMKGSKTKPRGTFYGVTNVAADCGELST